jgi:hypothetical protein
MRDSANATTKPDARNLVPASWMARRAWKPATILGCRTCVKPARAVDGRGGKAHKASRRQRGEPFAASRIVDVRDGPPIV